MAHLRAVQTEEETMERLLLRAEEVAETLGIGRSKTYELMASGVLPVIRIGRAVRVPSDRLRAWIKRRADCEHEDGQEPAVR